jgi:hypothetical protein
MRVHRLNCRRMPSGEASHKKPPTFVFGGAFLAECALPQPRLMTGPNRRPANHPTPSERSKLKGF